MVHATTVIGMSVRQPPDIAAAKDRRPDSDDPPAERQLAGSYTSVGRKLVKAAARTTARP